MPEPTSTLDETARSSVVQAAPTTFFGTVRRLGPGMILAGAIVGSGELIATTRVGAETGITLLWLIVFGCIVKVFVQVELGRTAITNARTGLETLDSVPGPRLNLPVGPIRSIRGHLFLWFWLVVMVLVLSQQGGIVGGVGQALSISVPLTEHGSQVNDLQNRWIDEKVSLAIARADGADVASLAMLQGQVDALEARVKTTPPASDPYIWGAILAVLTSIALYIGHYGLIQFVSTLLVALFTLVTILTVVLIQRESNWALSGEDLVRGFSFHVPTPGEGTARPMATALGAFGIIGVGAFELLMYPYWCLEKGYARFTGPREGTDAWADRARGWMRVMQIDVWVSMGVYTLATVAFFWLGAAVLGRTRLIPESDQMIRTLSEMYVPVFGGTWARTIFLVGAFAVLYSTFFVAAAGCARLLGDSLGLFGITDGTDSSRKRWTGIFCVLWPLAAYALYAWIKAPGAMVIWSGIGQALLLPFVGIAAVYQRYRHCDARLQPGRLWDTLLWCSLAALSVVALWSLYENVWRGLILTWWRA